MVQPAGVNALIAIVGGTSANAVNASQSASEDSDVGQQFSQLLSDSGKQYDDQANNPSLLLGKLVKNETLGALSAQEVTDGQQAALNSLLHARERVISPSDADELIARVDKILAQDRSPSSVQALTQIKEQLLRIARTGETKTIGEVLQTATAVKESKLSLLGLTALLSLRKAEATAKTHESQEEALANAAVLSHVPTAIFRPDSADDAAAKTTSDEPQTQGIDALVSPSDTISIITPLAAFTVSSVVSAAQTRTAANDAIQASQPETDIDTRIPPLTLAQPDTASLPEVSLPKWSAASAARKDQAEASFQSLAAAAGLARDALKAPESLGDANGTSVDGITSVNNPSHAGGFSHTQTVNAAQPVHVVPTHGYVNHAPVTEQVHVAVRQAAKDGIEQITVQLDPLELGRVEVNIQTNRDGLTQISFLVDKADTFDNLSRDARTLERALQEAGIKTDTGSMQFNLRQQPQQQQLHSDLNGQGQHQGQQHANANEDLAVSRNTLAAINAVNRHYIFNVRDGVDISA